MSKETDFTTSNQASWCPGCSNFGIRSALLGALAELDLKPHQTAMVFDIGCVGHGGNLFKVYGFHGLHGRTVPVAAGAKLANRKLTVIGLIGDGGAYGEGIGHLIEAARNNIDITLVVSNNHLYSLTKGQASPTLDQGVKTKSTPLGTIKPGLNPLLIALSCQAGFVSRGYADHIIQLKEMIKKAISHPGFSLVDVLQPCITLDQKNTRSWYQQRIYYLDKSWPVKNREKAWQKAQQWGRKIPLGIFFQERRLTYQENLPFLNGRPLISHSFKKSDFKKIIADFE